MTLGLKRGVVELVDHDPKWEGSAEKTIQRLWRVFGTIAKDIQHVGSTAIKHIKAKPIIDIAVAVDNFGDVTELMPALVKDGWSESIHHAVEDDMLIVDGGERSNKRAFHIHIVLTGSMRWKNYVCLRDYLNANTEVAKQYESVKIELASKHPNDRNAYTEGKAETIESLLREARIWDDFGREFAQIVRVEKGWSGDSKYSVTRKDGAKQLLRISPADRYDARKRLFLMLKEVDALGIPMCRPEGFGVCTDGVYLLETWVEGQDLEEILPLLPKTEQYALGLNAGEILRKIHSIPASAEQEEWATRFNRKIDTKIKKYRECGLRFDGDEKIVSYIEENRPLLENRPQCFQHGDYHVGNMMLENGELRIIDFDRYDFGDPWEEFNRIVWSAQASPHFATGQIRGYFGSEPPESFWRLLALYIGNNTLSSIYWAIPFGQTEVDTVMRQSQDVLGWYDGMRNPVPTWYLKSFHIQ